jgi:hypothetical protein
VDTGVEELRAAHAAASEGAWKQFCMVCGDTVAPEGTYQAWFAHFIMQRLSVLHVVREVDFGARHLGPDAGRVFPGDSLMVDIVVLREPIVMLPRRAALADPVLPCGAPNPRSGLERLGDFSVVSELKVDSTKSKGQGYGEVVRDFVKLSRILDAAQDAYPGHPIPAAYVGVLANHPGRRFNFELLKLKLEQADVRSGIQLLQHVVERPEPL